jgi:hypothetical protein
MIQNMLALLAVGGMASLTANEWELRQDWRHALFHGVVHIEARELNDRPFLLRQTDRIFAYHASECGRGAPVGTSFEPLLDEGLHYFEVHILSNENHIPLCFHLARDSRSVLVRLDNVNENFVFDASRGDFSSTDNGWGLPMENRLRVARSNLTESLIVSFDPPPSPSESGNLCTRCVTNAMIADPFCQSPDCSMNYLESTIRMMRHVLRRDDHDTAEAMTPVVRDTIQVCIAALNAPQNSLTKDDVIDYARNVLMGNSIPNEYGCGS